MGVIRSISKKKGNSGDKSLGGSRRDNGNEAS